jgi:hypothetical protein
MPDANNGSQSEVRNRPYVVLEQQDLGDVVGQALEAASIELDDDKKQLLAELAGDVYVEKARVPSRNAAHALTQVGRGYGLGLTPPLVAVSERMFRPRRVSIEAGDPKVSLS